jgi:hypothetical protein
LPYDNFACSAICELVLTDYFDECSVAETRALAEELRRDPQRLKAELARRRIRE